MKIVTPSYVKKFKTAVIMEKGENSKLTCC